MQLPVRSLCNLSAPRTFKRENHITPAKRLITPIKPYTFHRSQKQSTLKEKSELLFSPSLEPPITTSHIKVRSRFAESAQGPKQIDFTPTDEKSTNEFNALGRPKLDHQNVPFPVNKYYVDREKRRRIYHLLVSPKYPSVHKRRTGKGKKTQKGVAGSLHKFSHVGWLK